MEQSSESVVQNSGRSDFGEGMYFSTFRISDSSIALVGELIISYAPHNWDY